MKATKVSKFFPDFVIDNSSKKKTKQNKKKIVYFESQENNWSPSFNFNIGASL